MVVYDKKTGAVLEASQIGKFINLRGINFEGSFKLSHRTFNHPQANLIHKEDYEEISHIKYKGGWPKRLVDILLLKTKVTSVRINFNPPVKEKKPKEKPVKVKPKIDKTKVKIKPKGQVTTLNDICDQVGIKPASARGKLRGKVEKPKEGWKWTDPKEIDKIIVLLSE